MLTGMSWTLPALFVSDAFGPAAISAWHVIVRWIHDASAGAWVGLLLLVLVLQPLSRRKEKMAPPDPTTAVIGARLKPLFAVLAAVMLITGVNALAFPHPSRGFWYIFLLIIKILLSMGVVGFLLYHIYMVPARVQPASKQADASQPSPSPEPQRDLLLRPNAAQRWWTIGLLAGSLLIMLLGEILRTF